MKGFSVSEVFKAAVESRVAGHIMALLLDHMVPRALLYGAVATGVGLSVPMHLYQQGFDAGALAAMAVDGGVQLVRAGLRLSRRFADEAAGRVTVPQPRTSQPHYQPAPARLSQAHS